MLYQEFREYLEENASHSLELFIEKATDYQLKKNKKRSGSAKWNDAKVHRAIDDMLDRLIDSAYEQIKVQKGVPKYNGKQIWIDFMNEHEFLEMFADGVAETEFD
ncbi:hypothetical protein M222_2242 [Enterococcus faecalis AZ19]|uniref:hypothetical protein n=1 Tax=Enterococcus faecalis TaxID=1351 RepID=UPI000459626C|nr:hypothetical protein [Enterococcus faecalis]KAJ72472.1 hypothetical protein M222_2242 [Enterococcus faecalis AZ19]